MTAGQAGTGASAEAARCCFAIIKARGRDGHVLGSKQEMYYLGEGRESPGYAVGRFL